jgi:hypothetical protein
MVVEMVEVEVLGLKLTTLGVLAIMVAQEEAQEVLVVVEVVDMVAPVVTEEMGE